MTDQAFYQAQALEMASIQAEYLVNHAASLTVDPALRQAIRLIQDALQYLGQPRLAVGVALGFHPAVERWSAWPAWATALDMILTEERAGHIKCPGASNIRLLNCRSQAARELGDFETALTAATTALQLAEAAGERGLVASTLNKLGLIALSRDDLTGAREYWAQASQYGIAHLPAEELGHIYMNMGNVAVKQGAFLEAHRCFDEALGYYRVQDNALHIAKVQANIGDVLSREGHLQAALQLLEEACATFQALGARHNYGLVQNDLGYVALRLGHFEQALHAFKTAVAEFERLGSLNGKARVLSNIAELYVTSQQWDKATDAIQEARALALLCERPLLVSMIDVDWGRMLAAQGEYTAARRIWLDALEVQCAHGAAAASYTQQLLDGLPNDLL